MVRIAVVLMLLVLAGCGGVAREPELTAGSAREPSSSRDPRPVTAPPRSPDPSAPPPAWVHTERGSRWLAFDSYCWSARGHSACVDMIAPNQRRDVPILVVRSGETVRFHLAFSAKSVDVYVGAYGSHSILHRRHTRAVTWRAPSGRGGRLVMLAVLAPAAGGSAGYLARIRVR